MHINFVALSSRALTAEREREHRKKAIAMDRFVRMPANFVSLILRVAVSSMLLAAPVLAVPSASNNPANIIEAPTAAKTGMGLVLLFSLQRA